VLVSKTARQKRANERAYLYEMFDGRCAYCGREMCFDQMTVDHKVSLANGGADSLENKLPACLQCNNRKGSMTLGKFRKSLVNQVSVVRGMSPLFRMLEAYGIIEVHEERVTFYFEKCGGQNG